MIPGRWYVLALLCAVRTGLAATALGQGSPSGSGAIGVVPLTDQSAVLVLDLSTRQQIATVATLSHPQDAIASGDGRRVYILEMGTDSSPGHTVAVLDPSSLRVVDRIDLRPYRQPHWAVLDVGDRVLWVASAVDRAIVELDLAGRRIARVWRVPDPGPWNFAVTAHAIVTANFDAGTATIFDRSKGVARTVRLSGKPLGIATASGGDEVWISTMGTDSMYVLQPSTDSIVARFPSDGSEPARIAVASDSTEVAVTNSRSNTLSVYDSRTRHVRQRVSLPGTGPKGLIIDASGRTAYVSLMDSHQVVAIDESTWRVAWSVSVHGTPERMAVVRGLPP
jgi:YVTN family beta-propeller protein